MRRLLVGAVLLLLAVAPASGGPTRATRVVLITLDTLRFDQLDPDGEASRMPRTRDRARGGAWFSHFYTASPVTQPAHATMFTGLQPWEHGITRNGLVLPGRYRSVVEVLKEAGFSTHAVVASFPLTARFGFAAGFDHFSERFTEASGRANRHRKWEREWSVPGERFFALGDAVTDRAIESLDNAKGERQFFWFHYFDAHSPYGSSRGAHLTKRVVLDEVRHQGKRVASLVEGVREGYAADVAYLDVALDRLFRRLEQDADRVETHVLLVADHGESLGEQGVLGHGSLLNEAQIRVPAFILSSKVAPGTRSDVTGSIDVAPTLLSLAGVASDRLQLRGRDLTRPPDASARAFSMRRTFREGRGRETRLDGSRLRLDGHLYCEVDPGGAIHLGTGSEPPFTAFEEDLARASRHEDVDPQTRKGLEALGYVD